MAELTEAFSKLNNNNNKLFCFISKVPISRNIQKLEQNENTSDFEWKDVKNQESLEILNIELPISNEIHWELFCDEGYNDKGKMILNNESMNTNRYLSFKIDRSIHGKNFFINLKCTKTVNKSNRESVEDIYDNYNCFINIDKITLSQMENKESNI